MKGVAGGLRRLRRGARAVSARGAWGLLFVLGVGCAADTGDSSSRAGAARTPGPDARAASDSAPAAPGAGDPTAADFGNASAGMAAPAPTTVLNVGGNDCAPGHYLGELTGEYYSQVWANGTAPIPFATGEINGQPGMEFWLERTERECTDVEFCADFEVKGGKLRGWAIPNADATNPMGGGFGARFEMELSGELDCRTGEFRGELRNACYDVLGTLYRMEGTLGASYDTATDAFVMGDWALDEMPLPNLPVAPDPNIGGAGGWNATLSDDGSSPIAEGDGLCDKASGFDTQL
jgi:hypothetical protein